MAGTPPSATHITLWDFDTDQQEWANANCVSQPLECFSEASDVSGAWKLVERIAHILCTNLPLKYMDQFQFFAEQQSNWDVCQMETGHDYVVTEPTELADILFKYVD
jgi:hypothetical protein